MDKERGTTISNQPPPDAAAVYDRDKAMTEMIRSNGQYANDNIVDFNPGEVMNEISKHESQIKRVPNINVDGYFGSHSFRLPATNAKAILHYYDRPTD